MSATESGPGAGARRASAFALFHVEHFPRRMVAWAFLHLALSAAGRTVPAPLPLSVAAASEQATAATLSALDAGRRRLRLDLFGDAIEQPEPLPLGALCERLTTALCARKNVHFFFDTPLAVEAWARLPISRECRFSLLADGVMHPDDSVLVLVRPRNRAPATRTRHLEAVQQLVCGAGDRPVIMANPDLEALLLTARVGHAVPPMFLSDFEQAFFLAEALAKTGDVTAVRRVWGGAWETYRVEELSKWTTPTSAAPAAVTQAPAVADAAVADAAVAEDARDARDATLQFSSLVRTTSKQPRAAEALVRHVRRERKKRAAPRRTPSSVDERAAWSAEDGWDEDGE